METPTTGLYSLGGSLVTDEYFEIIFLNKKMYSETVEIK